MCDEFDMHTVSKDEYCALSKYGLCKWGQSYESKACFKRVLYLSKEILWFSVAQRAAKLQAVKVGALK